MSQYSLRAHIRRFLKSIFVIGVGKSLFISLFFMSFVPLALVSVINYFSSYLGLTVIAEKSLLTTSELRVQSINNFFKQNVDFLELESKQPLTISYFDALNQYYKKYNKISQSSKLFDQHSNVQKNYQVYYEQARFKNLYFFNKEGILLYSFINEFPLSSDFLKNPNIHPALSQTLSNTAIHKTAQFSDIVTSPLGNKNAESFICYPLTGENQQEKGFLVIKLNTSQLQSIMANKADLGETGEAYIIGKDLFYRSTSRFEQEEAVLKKKSANDKSRAWLKYIHHQNDKEYLSANKMDEYITTYANDRGRYVLGLYRNLYEVQKLGVNWALIEEIEHDEAFAYAKQLSDIAKVAFIITIVIIFFVSIIITNWFVGPIKKLSAWAKQVAMGELSPQKIRAPQNEVGEMVSTFNTLVDSLKSYADVSQSASYGDYSQTAQIRSDKDVLGKSMNRMVESFKNVVQQANKIANGDYSTDIKPRSDKDTLGIALYEMTEKLRQSSKEINEQDWLKTGINELDSTLSGQTDLKQLSSDVISFLCSYLNAQVGLFYILDEKKRFLELTSSYAFSDKKKVFEKFEIGEGVIGQVAKEGKTMSIEGQFENLPVINMGFNKKSPDYFITSPFIYEGNLMGVILLGSLHEFTDLQKQLFKTNLDSIAIAVNSAKARESVEHLLKQTQEQADELTVQQEELRQANEELEEQTKALKISEEHLKNQQEELKVINEELEERTNDLEIQRDSIRKKNEELRKAQAEIEQKAMDLEQASQYKSEFLANMSHELRTPLNSILVLSQLLKDNKSGRLSDKEVEFAKTINSSGSDLLDLINEILDLSKVEAGKIDLYIENLYFSDLDDFVTRTFEPLTNEKNLKLEFNIEKGAPVNIKTDVQRVYQIIKNLLSNAIKFTQKGSVTVTIFKPEKEIDLSISGLKHEDAVAISVKDTGVGIPEDKKDLIFEAFKQVDGTTSRKFGGTGLGLTISRSFAELLGGEIFLESIENEGTTFTLILPLSIAEIPEKQKIENKPELIKPSLKKPAKKTTKKEEVVLLNVRDDKENIEAKDKFILVIEDDENFAKVLYELAHEKGFKCIIALDGESGLHYADYYQPHAIILDIGLPGIDGYEVMDRLKDNTKTRHIPVHFISAADKSLEAMKMGAIGYLTKPVSQGKLDEAFKKIETIISKPIKKILVVEDDKIMQKSIVELLNDETIKITPVESGEEAYNLLLKEKFDCQILDLGLKDMSGFDLLEKIRKNKKISDLPIIIYTGKDLSKAEEEQLNKYADSIILKGARSFERLLSETTLFLHQLEADMPEKKREILRSLHNKEAVLEDKKILIVDDDMRNVFALSSLLEEKGLKTIAAKNGKEGIDKLLNNKDINLVLMDIMMPEMDGYEATKEIRKKQEYKNLPIIALTAKAMKEDREKCIAAGANDYLAKPVDTEKLLSLLRVWLYNK